MRRPTGAGSLLMACVALSAWLIAPPTAHAVITGVFTGTSTPVPCMPQYNGVRVCDQNAFTPALPRSTVKAFDGVPIDVRVAFPAQPATGPDGPYPLMILLQRYGGDKLPLSGMSAWVGRGYATLTMTYRGFGESCGTAAARDADPGCARGYIRMMDTRYEVRDAQELAASLVDDGVVDPQRIGATGNSYGGAATVALAALKDRKMLPDGSLVPWTSPHGIPISLAGGVATSAWTDLVAALVPNGSTLDYVEDAPYTGRTGILKQSWENALYAVGEPFFYAPPGDDPSADVTAWHTLLNGAKSYEDASGNPLPAVAMLRDEVTAHHSPYYIDDSETPAPLLISNGFTDDLFPADEAIRFYNRTRSRHPDARISLFLADIGHSRGQHKTADVQLQQGREVAWLERYVRGVGGVPFDGVEALTQTCPVTAPSGGSYFAASWAAIAPGEVRIDGPDTARISPSAGSSTVAQAFDPIAGGGACATAPAADQPGTATYRGAPVPPGGYTLMGSPTVTAAITAREPDSQIAARLLDVDPNAGTETLVARGLWRPATSSVPVQQVFQLHPNGYKFAAGHVVKLELLPNDNPSYGRVSDGQGEVRLAGLQLRLPVLEQPGSLNGLVRSPEPKVVPPGYALASDFRVDGYPRPKGASPVSVSLVPAFRPCLAPDTTHGTPLSSGACSPPVQTSSRVTIGTPDANGNNASSIGAAEFSVLPDDPRTPADEADVRINVSITDVRRRDNLFDYTDELEARTSLRITDRASGAGGDPATVVDTPLRATMPCVKTPGGAGEGSVCSVLTTADAIAPGTVLSGKRAIWELGDAQVYDGGADGVASTMGDNELFARQGLLVP